MFGLEGIKHLLQAVQELGHECVAVEEECVVEVAVVCRADISEAVHAVG